MSGAAGGPDARSDRRRSHELRPANTGSVDKDHDIESEGNGIGGGGRKRRLDLRRGSFAAATSPGPADLVLVHGKIHTQDSARSVAQALAVRGNTIVAVGTDEGHPRSGGAEDTHHRSGRSSRIARHHRRSHSSGQSSQDLGKCTLQDKMMTPADLKVRVAQCLKERPGEPEQWFEVVSVNPAGLTLTLADLDSILADRPLLFSGSDGHTVWANSAALKLAHITRRHPGSRGRAYRTQRGRTADGHVAGQCRGNSICCKAARDSRSRGVAAQQGPSIPCEPSGSPRCRMRPSTTI